MTVSTSSASIELAVTLEAIEGELNMPRHLHDRGVAVAAPVAQDDGSLVGLIASEQGPRPCVMMTFAPGREMARDDSDSYAHGRAVADLHAATDDWRDHGRRPPLTCSI